MFHLRRAARVTAASWKNGGAEGRAQHVLSSPKFSVQKFSWKFLLPTFLYPDAHAPSFEQQSLSMTVRFARPLESRFTRMHCLESCLRGQSSLLI